VTDANATTVSSEVMLAGSFECLAASRVRRFMNHHSWIAFMPRRQTAVLTALAVPPVRVAPELP
jgi:hypothetical protein